MAEEKKMNSVIQVIIGFLWIIFTLALLDQTWSWIQIIEEQIVDDFWNALYWVSMFVMIILIGFYAPIAMIINAFKDNEIDA